MFPRMGSIERGSMACRYCFGSNTTPIEVSRQIKKDKAEQKTLKHRAHVKAALLAMKAAGVQPLEPYPGLRIPWKVKCLSCGRESTPMYASIAKGQGGCFRCGRDYGDKPAYVYLVHDSAREVIKVGITNVHAHRITKYGGWKVIELIPTATGREAARIEAEVLGLWRLNMNLQPKLTRQELKGGGYTETADESGLEAAIAMLQRYKPHSGLLPVS